MYHTTGAPGLEWDYVDFQYTASDICDGSDHPDTMWQAVDVRDVLQNFYCEPDNYRKCYYWVKATLCSWNDIDFFKFSPLHKAKIVLRTTGDVDTAGGYAHVVDDEIFDFDGDDNSGEGLNFEIAVKYNVLPGEWIYIDVRAVGYHLTDQDYVLIVQEYRVD
jgi:hypothetical protein